jgi:hypothetical protein
MSFDYIKDLEAELEYYRKVSSISTTNVNTAITRITELACQLDKSNQHLVEAVNRAEIAEESSRLTEQKLSQALKRTEIADESSRRTEQKLSQALKRAEIADESSRLTEQKLSQALKRAEIAEECKETAEAYIKIIKIKAEERADQAEIFIEELKNALNYYSLENERLAKLNGCQDNSFC